MLLYTPIRRRASTSCPVATRRRASSASCSCISRRAIPLTAILPADATRRAAGRDAQALRLRQAAARAIRPLALARRRTAISAPPSPPAGRSRARSCRAVENSLRARRRRDADRLHFRHAASAFVAGYFRGALDRSRSPRCVVGARRQRAALLARHGAGHHLLGAARLAAGDRRRARRLGQPRAGLGPSALHRPAGGDHVRHPDGHHRAHREGAGRRHPAAGIRAARSRAKGLRDRRRVPPRREERRARPPSPSWDCSSAICSAARS